MTFHEALPVGLESSSALCDIELTAPVPAGDILQRLNRELPDGITILTATENVLKSSTAPATIKKYSVTLPDHPALHFPDHDGLARSIADFKARDTCMIQIIKKDKTIEVDLKKILMEISVNNDGVVSMALDANGHSMPKITSIMAAVFELGLREQKSVRIMKI